MSTYASRCSECGSARATTSVLAEGPYDLDILPGTRHHMLLNSNVPPLESDLESIRSMISRTGTRLVSLDDEILGLQARLAKLEEERTSLSNLRAWNMGILSPLRRMPPEILGDIFWWTLPLTSEAAAYCSPLNLDQSPWLLTRVSSRWRAVSLATPSLWSRIAISYGEDSYPPSLPMTHTHIHRAQKLQIHFYGSEIEDSGAQIELFELLARHSSQWEHLSLGLTTYLVPLLPGLRDRLPSLVGLWIQWQSPESQSGAKSIDCFHTAPRLVDVGIYNEFRAIPVFLPSHQLTRYDLDATWETHRGILALGSNLVEARIVVAFDGEPWSDPNPIADLLCLRRLFVSHLGILDYIRAPALEGIAIYIKDSTWSDGLDPLQSFLLNSKCRPGRLCLKGAPTASAATEILRKIPSVTALSIVCHPADRDPHACSAVVNTLISQLVIPDPIEPPSRSHPLIAPQLSEIQVGCQNDTYIDYNLYLKMLQSRWIAEKCPLKAATLAIHLGTTPDPQTLNGLETLHQDGLDLLLLEGLNAPSIIARWTYLSD
ncbi:hypothetical protein DFH07DRAFT_291497 [Mycena maculata]|uniref:F-box domain-containing protein n=1 Tax=Mycena maculata TaxID=230809 RepID=A0AAD7JPH3_9AGAR|nr:hypothetical protein DFH07DRAFT_291497 [Mycena maculata]